MDCRVEPGNDDEVDMFRSLCDGADCREAADYAFG
jgi:hypothetical protein